MEETAEVRRGPLPNREVVAFLWTWSPSFLVPISLSICLFGLNWWITREPEGGARLGLIVGAANLISVAAVAAFSGVLDRMHRRRSVNRVLFMAAACAIGVGFVFRSSSAGLFDLLAAAVLYFLLESTYSLYMAVMENVNVDMAPREWRRERTATLVQMQPQVERVVVPFVGGALIAAGALAILPVVSAALIVLVLVLVLVTRHLFDSVSPQHSTSGSTDGLNWTRRLFRDARGAAHLIRRDRDLVFLLVLGVLGNLVVFPFYAMLPAYIGHYGLRQHEQAVLYGRAGSAYGIGMILAALIMIRLRKRPSRRPIGTSALYLMLVVAILLTLTFVDRPQMLIAAMGAVGAVFVLLGSTVGAVWLDRTPAEMRVRVFSLRRLTAFSSIPLGTSLMGFGGAAFGYVSFLRMLLIFVALVLVASWTYRTMRVERPYILGEN